MIYPSVLTSIWLWESGALHRAYPENIHKENVASSRIHHTPLPYKSRTVNRRAINYKKEEAARYAIDNSLLGYRDSTL
jgi:hypothetical protein